MDGFAIYRFPGDGRRTLVRGRVDVCPTVRDVAGYKGFVIAPFDAERHPILVIRPDQVVDDVPEGLTCHCEGHAEETSDYYADFERAMGELRSGRLQKVVVARAATEPRAEAEPMEMFDNACRMYPNAFVALFSTEKTGTWLIATPELLLARGGESWHTMALAGTMTTDGDWSDKNRCEQRIVDEYIGRTLRKYSDDITQTGPAPVRAGALTHLRTDFCFTMRDDALGALLADLHPTPAVCGLPKAAAYDEITRHHSLDRQYYSGFCGPVGVDGETRLYVSLRCMRIDASTCTLFAGGGLLPQSDAPTEYAETEAKLQTMRQCLATSKISTY